MNNEIQSKKCPFCNKIIIGKHSIYANHIRWCNKNPNYLNINESAINKLKNTRNLKRNNYTLKCKVCNKEYNLVLTEKQFLSSKYRKTCSKSCAAKLSTLNCNNDVRKEHIKNSLDKKYNFIEKTCPYCNKKFITKKMNKIYCSTECAYKYRSLKSSLKLDFIKRYRHECKFCFSINEFDNYFNKYNDLIKKYGFYSASNRGNNKNGVSRDHKVSIKHGYNNLIDPYIISHPANCDIIQQIINSSKNVKCSITLEELTKNIKEFNLKYGEYPNKINYDIIPEITHRYNP